MRNNKIRPLYSLFSIGVSAVALSLFSFGSAFAAVSQSDISVKSGVWPVMIRIDYNPILQIEVEGGSGETLEALKLDFTKTTKVSDIECVEVYVGGSAYAAGTLFGTARPSKANPIVTVKSSKPVALPTAPEKAKAVSVWVSVKMKNNADITGTVACTASQMVIKKKPYVVNSVSANQRIGYAVAKAGDLGSKFYRIPAITRTKSGALVATFDIRYDSWKDLPAKIDIGVSRSTDNGQTWTSVESVLKDKGLGIGNGVGDPGILTDLSTGEVWISALGAPKSGHPIFSSSTGTSDAAQCGQMLLISSKDDGKTWSKPINITQSIKRLSDKDTANWGLLFQGPGAGICTKDGTLIFPAQAWGNKGKGTWGTLVYSKDHGKTWTSSPAIPWGGSESTCVELKDGSIMLNVRQGSPGERIVATTKNLGKKWEKFDGTKLRQPRSLCQGALLISNDKRDLYFSNPNSTGNREHMTLKYSKNGGKTWSNGLLYDERKCAGYSTLAFSDDKQSRIGVLYEGAGAKDALYLFFLSIPTSEVQHAK